MRRTKLGRGSKPPQPRNIEHLGEDHVPQGKLLLQVGTVKLNFRFGAQKPRVGGPFCGAHAPQGRRWLVECKELRAYPRNHVERLRCSASNSRHRIISSREASARLGSISESDPRQRMKHQRVSLKNLNADHCNFPAPSRPLKATDSSESTISCGP